MYICFMDALIVVNVVGNGNWEWKWQCARRSISAFCMSLGMDIPVVLLEVALLPGDSNCSQRRWELKMGMEVAMRTLVYFCLLHVLDRAMELTMVLIDVTLLSIDSYCSQRRWELKLGMEMAMRTCIYLSSAYSGSRDGIDNGSNRRNSSFY
jgi:hypothetical protein